MGKKVVSVNDKVPFLHGKLIEAKGIVPSGNIDITSMAQVDVTNYATAQVVDADLIAENIKKDVNILGVVGSFEGGGGGFNPAIVTITEITIGANNISNTQDAINYFGTSASSFEIYVLKEAPTINNQILLVYSPLTTLYGAGVWRYRNGSINIAQVNPGYDGYLIESTTYYKVVFAV